MNRDVRTRGRVHAETGRRGSVRRRLAATCRTTTSPSGWWRRSTRVRRAPGHRAAHAKGVLCAANFTATAAAARLSRALHLRGEVRAHVRFSNGSGDPTAPDTARDARGLAVKFYLADGTTTDVVAISLPAFFARTPKTCSRSTTHAAPTPRLVYSTSSALARTWPSIPRRGPRVTAAMTHPLPASYAALTYNSLHTFGFEGETGTTLRRYHFVPEHGDESLSEAEAAVHAPDYLSEELEKRFTRGSATFHVRVELAAVGDSIDDPTAVWPEGREQVELGQLRVTGRAFDRERAGDVLVFDPTRVTDGIQCPDDPILHRVRRVPHVGESPGLRELTRSRREQSPEVIFTSSFGCNGAIVLRCRNWYIGARPILRLPGRRFRPSTAHPFAVEAPRPRRGTTTPRNLMSRFRPAARRD